MSFSDHRVFQEIGKQRMIGTEHESRGLYYLKNDANSVACVNSTSL